MGTFHHDKGELHGITVVVDTHGPRVYIGRCDTQTSEAIVLLDADMHETDAGGVSKEEYIARAARFGHWNRHRRIDVPLAEVSSIRRLGDIAHEPTA